MFGKLASYTASSSQPGRTNHNRRAFDAPLQAAVAAATIICPSIITSLQGITWRRATAVNHRLLPQSVLYSSVFESLSHPGSISLQGTLPTRVVSPVFWSRIQRFHAPRSKWLYASHRPSGDKAG